MRLNLKSARKLKAELGDKTKLSEKQLMELEGTDILENDYVPEDYECYRKKVQMIRISKNIKVYFIPLVDRPQYPPYPMWIVEKIK